MILHQGVSMRCITVRYSQAKEAEEAKKGDATAASMFATIANQNIAKNKSASAAVLLPLDRLTIAAILVSSLCPAYFSR